MYQRTNFISYTFTADNGFSALVGVEQGANTGSDNKENYYLHDTVRRIDPNAGIDVKNVVGMRSFHSGSRIDSYTPNVLADVRYIQG